MFLSNVILILSGAVLAQLFTMLVTHSLVLGKLWRKALKKKPEAKIPLKYHAISFVLFLLTAVIFNFIVPLLGITAGIDYFIFAGLMSLAFALPPLVLHVLYSGFAKHLIWISLIQFLGANLLIALPYALLI